MLSTFWLKLVRILAAFEARVDNDRAAEFANAIDNVCRILRFRIEDRVVG